MSDCIGLVGRVFGHAYKSRYHYGAPALEEVKGNARQSIEAIKASQPKTYVGDICIRCGNRLKQASSSD